MQQFFRWITSARENFWTELVFQDVISTSICRCFNHKTSFTIYFHDSVEKTLNIVYHVVLNVLVLFRFALDVKYSVGNTVPLLKLNWNFLKLCKNYICIQFQHSFVGVSATLKRYFSSVVGTLNHLEPI